MVTQKSPGVIKYDSNHIEFAITTYCQAKCRSCARTNENTGEKEDWLTLKHMDLNVFKRTLEESSGVNIRSIDFCGEFGDPMMHPEIDKFIETALTFTDKVQISTNGGLRNAEWYSTIANKYKEKLEINWAIDGASHDINWKYREGVDWNRAMKNMQTYIENGGNGHWWYILFEWNWHQIPLARKMAKDIGIVLTFRYNSPVK